MFGIGGNSEFIVRREGFGSFGGTPHASEGQARSAARMASEQGDTYSVVEKGRGFGGGETIVVRFRGGREI